MTTVILAGTGLYAPPHSIDNRQLVDAFNAYVDHYNHEHRHAIEAGQLQALEHSSSEFITQVSGILSRRLVDAEGVLDVHRMRPHLPERRDEELSLQAEMAVAAAREALERAGRSARDVDCVIAACSNHQRAYPAIAIEVQHALGIEGCAWDMNVACSSATFGLQLARDAIAQGSARRVLVVNPEICSGHLEFRDRDCHFIFGDACTSLLLEAMDGEAPPHSWAVLGSRLRTHYSNNIRNNFGFLNRADPHGIGARDKLFKQNGRQVFREVCPMVAAHILEHLDQAGLRPDQLRRLWLHQANLGMNRLIAQRVLGREASADEAPVVLDEFGNTSSAGSVIAFHKHHDDLPVGSLGVLSSFGAGYSIGSVILRKR